jgi:hypothetical protein
MAGEKTTHHGTDLANASIKSFSPNTPMSARTDTLEGCAALMRENFGREEPFLVELVICGPGCS